MSASYLGNVEPLSRKRPTDIDEKLEDAKGLIISHKPKDRLTLFLDIIMNSQFIVS
jgi:hypothetical protein